VLVLDVGFGQSRVLPRHLQERCSHAAGDFGSTALAENGWSVAKRYLSRMYGRFVWRYLPLLLREWAAWASRPELFRIPTDYLQLCLFRIS